MRDYEELVETLRLEADGFLMDDVPDMLMVGTLNDAADAIEELMTKKEDMSRIRSPEHCKNISKAKLGHTVSDETRVKISKTKRTAASTRRGADNPKARAVVCIETGIVYPTVAAAKLATGVQNISRCCAGRRKTCGGYHWKYYEEEDHVDS